MQFKKNLYIGQNIHNPSKLQKKILNRSFFVNAYIITLALNADQLEIFEARILRQKYYHESPRTIVGVAADYQEALDLILKITQDAVKHGYEGRLKEYLTEKED